MTIKNKIVLGFFAVLVLFTAVTFINHKLSQRVKMEMNVIAEYENLKQNFLSIEKLSIDMETGLRGFLLTEDEEFLQPYYNAIPELTKIMKEQYSLIDQKSMLSKKVAPMETSISNWINEFAEPLIYAKRKMIVHPEKREEYEKLFQSTLKEGRGKEITDSIRVQFDEFDAFLVKEEQGKKADLIKYNSQVDAISLALNIAAVVAAILISILIIRSITNRIRKIVRFAGSMAQGNYGSKIIDNKQDELAAVSIALNHMAKVVEEKIIQLEKSFIELKEAKKTQEQFFANMSHEIRTPMNGVSGNANLLLETTLNEDQNEYVQAIKESSEGLLVVINDILDYSKLRAGKMVFEKNQTNIREVIDGMKTILMTKANERGNTLILDIDEKIHPYIVCDRVRLSQVFLNLVGNAIKFTENGKISIKTEYTGGNAWTQTIRFTVSDTGIGIPKEKQETIFESYSQLHSNLNGTGLGLYIVKQLISALGGEIQVKSDEGKGASFSFTLTFQKCEKPAKNIEIDKEKSDLSGIRILLAEDDHINQKVAVKLLKNKNAEVAVAENGKQVLEMVAADHYDIILMDIHMPVMDGLECAKKIRSSANESVRNIPIIALTANAMKEEQEKCLAEGMSDYISKPFSPQHLFQRILFHVRHKSSLNSEIINAKINRVDLTDLKMIAEGDDQFLKESIDIYLTEMPLAMKSMQEYLEINNYKNIHSIAHKMKSSASLIGATTLLNYLDKIEHYNIELGSKELSVFIEVAATELSATVAVLKQLHSNGSTNNETIMKR